MSAVSSLAKSVIKAPTALLGADKPKKPDAPAASPMDDGAKADQMALREQLMGRAALAGGVEDSGNEAGLLSTTGRRRTASRTLLG